MSRSKDAGKIIRTKTGLLGYTKNSDGITNGKAMVYITDADYKPILNEDKKPLQLMCKIEELQVIGYRD